MKRLVFIVTILIAFGFATLLCYNHYVFQDAFYFLKGEITIDTITCENDLDSDGVNDIIDIVLGARQEVWNRTRYQSTYYKGGYPPENEGVCTDVIWRALKNCGYDLKASMDKDILKNPEDYSNGVVIPDPNIDFRRVKNQYVFFKKYATSLTTQVKPYNKKNLYEWQAGDIVVLRKTEHVAIISDKRRKDGIPFVLHNSSTFAMEEDLLLKWSRDNRIIGHFRFQKNTLE